METNSIITETKPKGQKYLGNHGMIILITVLNVFSAMTTDIYLPGLPRMAESFHASFTQINLTLILFFIFFALGNLFWGPLSDKYGRKVILLIGLIGYTATSILCASAGSVYLLIIWRIFQAIASGAISAVAMALVKDSYDGERRVSVLVIVQSMGMIAPIVAPVIGAFILNFTSWRGVFGLLSVIGLIATICVMFMQETLEQRYTGNIFQSLGRLGVVLKNPGFSLLLITFSLLSIPFMSFISVSAYIYIDTFSLSEQAYSFYFAGNALAAVFGPLLYIKLHKRYHNNSIIIACFIVPCISGLLICTLGNITPWLFALSLLPATIASSVSRPPSSNLLLEQQDQDTGSASSLMNCSFTLLGSIGMMLISLNWTDRILIMGLMYTIISLIGLLLWLYISRKSLIRQIQ